MDPTNLNAAPGELPADWVGPRRHWSPPLTAEERDSYRRAAEADAARIRHLEERLRTWLRATGFAGHEALVNVALRGVPIRDGRVEVERLRCPF